METPRNLLLAMLWLLGGLGLFLYGIDLMGRALRRAAGSRIRKAFGWVTRSRWHGLLTGCLVTALVQSSSATTVMVVGFINAGLLTFPNSIGLILGANIGTTLTPEIMAFNVDALALPLIGIGFVVNALARHKGMRMLGLAGMGFGMLFMGLILMKLAVAGYNETVRGWVDAATQGGAVGWLTAFLVATAATAVVQSSAAVIVMVQALAFEGGLSGLPIAVPLILGAHVGTCVTALLGSMRASQAARRAAVAHLVFNVAGVGVTLVLLPAYLWAIPLTSGELARQVANCHLAIKLVNVAICLPFSVAFARLIEHLVRGKVTLDATPVHLDFTALGRPARAVECAEKELRRIFDVCMDMIRDAVTAYLSHDARMQEQVRQREDIVDDLCNTLGEYLATTSRGELPEELTVRPPLLLHILSDTERIGDHADNIAELGERHGRDESEFSEAAVAEVRDLSALVVAMGKAVARVLNAPGRDAAVEALRAKHRIDKSVDRLLDNHEQRLANGQCSVMASLVFVDLVMNLRRVANHLRNIAMSAVSGTPEHTLEVRRMERDVGTRDE